jgi:hypothetical protein
MDYRNLTQKEIDQLKAAGCEAEDWGNVLTSGRSVDHIKRVRFSGTVRFGRFEREFELPGTAYHRAFVILPKKKPTPVKYPRKAGLPAKEPLH